MILNDFHLSKGVPTGGTSKGLGIEIRWQDGALRDGLGNSTPANGAFVEDVIEAAIQRLRFYNTSKMRCRENTVAIEKLKEALKVLHERRVRRMRQGIAGMHKEDPQAIT